MNNTITIITPSLNQGRFIEETINSVLSQDGDFEIDYIIADGGSTDGALDIVKKYEKLLEEGKYSVRCKGIEYRWWSRPDKGQSNAINQGMKMAKGDILAWINSDDFYEPGVFRFIMKQFQENLGIDLVYGSGNVIDEKSEKKETIEIKQGDLNTLLKRGNFIFQPSTFFTKKAIEQTGLLDESLHYAMDYDLWIKIFKNGKTLCVSKSLSNFRVWDDSKTISRQEKFLADRKKIAKRYGGNIIDPETIGMLRRKMKFLNYFKKTTPRLYKFCKNNFILCVDCLRYKERIKK